MNLLETKALSIQIGNKIICESLALTLAPGETLGILGPNGSGKTTLLKTLAGLLTPTHGLIHVQGKPITDYSHKDIARSLGLLLQNTPTPFPQSVMEYCKQSRYPHPHRTAANHQAIIEQALIAMDLCALKDQPIHTLSGGEYKRTCIAGLLAQAPQIYLLDEVTNHLDMRHQINVLNHFHALANKQKAGIIMSLHNIHLAAHFCQKILMLFGNGNFLYGETRALLNEKILADLYQCPLHLFQHESSSAWLPALSI